MASKNVQAAGVGISGLILAAAVAVSNWSTPGPLGHRLEFTELALPAAVDAGDTLDLKKHIYGLNAKGTKVASPAFEIRSSTDRVKIDHSKRLVIGVKPGPVVIQLRWYGALAGFTYKVDCKGDLVYGRAIQRHVNKAAVTDTIAVLALGEAGIGESVPSLSVCNGQGPVVVHFTDSLEFRTKAVGFGWFSIGPQ